MFAVLVVVAAVVVAVTIVLVGKHCDDYHMTDVPAANWTETAVLTAVDVDVGAGAGVGVVGPQTQSDVHTDNVRHRHRHCHHHASYALPHSCWCPESVCVRWCWADVVVAVVCQRA